MESIGGFEIQRELGRGAMGVVFEAMDARIGRRVAIKVLRMPAFPSAQEQAEAQRRFEREAATAGRLSHPNIVTIYQFGEHEGHPYLVMEFVPGESLDKWIAQGGGKDPASLIAILRQVASALDHAHASGVQHRDVKPANIMLREDGAVKVADFGIARQTGETITRTGAVLGTPVYMAPEQVRGEKLDGRMDQWALAVMAYRILTGQFPFYADGELELARKIVAENPVPAHKVNPALPQACSAPLGMALTKDREGRFSDCQSFVTALALALQAASVPPLPPSPQPKAPTEPESNRRASLRPIPRRWLYAGVGIIAAAILASSFWMWPQSPARAVINSFVADPSSVEKGQSVTLHWSTGNANAVALTKLGAVEGEGSRQVAPGATTKYTLTAKGAGGDDSRTVTVEVTNPPPPGSEKAVSIPPGSFMMGCSGESECYDDEKPAHRVTITRGFLLGKTEVTQANYEQVMKGNPSSFKGPDRPVENITWNQAQQYCNAVGGRLPTEPEWEYAARAGSSTSRFGDLDDIAWYMGNSGNETHAVSQKVPNAWGLYDMLGNVWEWTADYWKDSYQDGAAFDRSTRVLRGGSWGHVAGFSRVSVRYLLGPLFRYNDIGVRCAWDNP